MSNSRTYPWLFERWDCIREGDNGIDNKTNKNLTINHEGGGKGEESRGGGEGERTRAAGLGEGSAITIVSC